MIKEADFVIVGAGSSGCVLADKLSADGRHTVLLVESGPTDKTWLVDMPRGIGKLLVPGGSRVWDYDVSTGGNRPQEHWLKGKTIGGSSSVNGMVYVRGHPADYDGWEQAGCAGWGWKDIGPCFVEMESHELGPGSWRGGKGPLKISLHPAGDPLCEAVLSAAEQAGVPRVADVNDAWNGGFGYQPRTIWKGRRQSAAKAFLHPALPRPNLHVVSDTHVSRIVFEGRKAVGIELRNQSGNQTVRINREVILSAGALHSPKILQLSGVGPAALLTAYGIPVVADAPGVGENLREHRYLAVQYKVTGGSLNREFTGSRILVNLVRYLLTNAGPMSHAAHELCGFVKTRPHLDRPDAQIGVGLYSIGKTANGMEIEPHPGITLGGYLTRPESQGTVRIQSRDPAAPLAVDANYLSAESDREGSIALLRFIRRMADQPALKPYIIAETQPGPEIVGDEEIVDAFLTKGSTAYHVAGTCRMGGDPASVVDPRLRVRGVEGVRVVDTSVMPSLPSGNTNGPAMAFGLRAAQLILSEIGAR